MSRNGLEIRERLKLVYECISPAKGQFGDTIGESCYGVDPTGGLRYCVKMHNELTCPQPMAVTGSPSRWLWGEENKSTKMDHVPSRWL